MLEFTVRKYESIWRKNSNFAEKGYKCINKWQKLIKLAGIGLKNFAKES